MAITSSEAIKFTNEQVRQSSEKLRNLYYELKAMQTDWNGGINTLFPVDAAEIVEDGRDSEGVSRVSGNDVVLLMTQINTFISQMEGAGVLGVVQKPCVRVLEVS